MKKLLVTILCVILSYSICSCGSQQAIQITRTSLLETSLQETKPNSIVTVEQLIVAIGDVSVSGGCRNAITAAVDALYGLSEEDRSLVSNLSELEYKSGQYNTLAGNNFQRLVDLIHSRGTPHYKGLDVDCYMIEIKDYNYGLGIFSKSETVTERIRCVPSYVEREYGLGSQIFLDVVKQIESYPDSKGKMGLMGKTQYTIEFDYLTDQFYFRWDYYMSQDAINWESMAKIAYGMNLSDYRKGFTLPQKIYNNIADGLIALKYNSNPESLRKEVDNDFQCGIKALETYLFGAGLQSLEDLARLKNEWFVFVLDENGNMKNVGSMDQNGNIKEQ